MTDLVQRSIEIILKNQSESGAYIASPNFANYRYCWFRDGAFTAYALDLAGQYQSAARFHKWATHVILSRRPSIEKAIRKAGQGLVLASEDILNTRYSPDGSVADEEWPNFQLDGFGTWLWALNEQQHITGNQLPADWLEAARLVAGYLLALWRMPCFDSWEESPDALHTYTLAAIYGGLRSFATYLSMDIAPLLNEMSNLVLTAGIKDGHFTKSLESNALDANLLGVALPYGLVAIDDPRMQATVSAIERELRSCEGGLRRYATDTYYGGGDWILLTAWLGWYYAKVGDRQKAEQVLRWVETQADADGELPEQVPSSSTSTKHYEEWLGRWGSIAKPLLWSHAMHIILRQSL